MTLRASLPVSVILCTHNPRADFLDKTLASLRAQTLGLDHWELLLIDNRSDDPLASRLRLDWHPRARVVREDELGLTPARLRGLAEAQGELLVFVDDDNILQNDYLAVAVDLATSCPFLGAWGGSTIGEFEVAPPDWARPYLCYLAIREVTRFVWGNEYRYDLVPTGAGLCVRRSIAETYARATRPDPLRRELGRRGAALTSGEDSDLAFTAVDLGFGLGLSPRLSLRHLMPASRLQLAYLERLLEGVAHSGALVLQLRGGGVPSHGSSSRLARWLAAYRLWRQPPAVRRLERARARGAAAAGRLIADRFRSRPAPSVPF